MSDRDKAAEPLASAARIAAIIIDTIAANRITAFFILLSGYLFLEYLLDQAIQLPVGKYNVDDITGVNSRNRL